MDGGDSFGLYDEPSLFDGTSTSSSTIKEDVREADVRIGENGWKRIPKHEWDSFPAS